MSPNPNELTISGLACVRGDVTLFAALDFSVAAGDVLQIQGANGSGKTSLLRLLCGLSPPAAGTIRWNGVDIAEQAGDYRCAVSYIGHRRGVSEELSPLENLEFACALHHPAAPPACRDALTALGLDSDGRAQIEQLLEQHAARGGLSVIATHQPLQLDTGRVRTLRIDES